jgi:hypothetical protein
MSEYELAEQEVDATIMSEFEFATQELERHKTLRAEYLESGNIYGAAYQADQFISKYEDYFRYRGHKFIEYECPDYAEYRKDLINKLLYEKHCH